MCTNSYERVYMYGVSTVHWSQIPQTVLRLVEYIFFSFFNFIRDFHSIKYKIIIKKITLYMYE